MTIYTWFKIFNKVEFEALGLTSKLYTLNLENIGIKDFLVTKGNLIGVYYDEVFLCVKMNDKNPFAMDGYAVYIDANNDVYWGIEVDET